MFLGRIKFRVRGWKEILRWGLGIGNFIDDGLWIR